MVCGYGCGCVGSSPRGRGKPRPSGSTNLAMRLIPARAGKTWTNYTGARLAPAHPRAGGENFSSWRVVSWLQGSSPRGRGKRCFTFCVFGLLRLIPARAGKTGTHLPTHPRKQAHPRAGGENCVCHCAFAFSVGSSPRGRGKHMLTCQHTPTRRLIPARAGKTGCVACRLPAFRAHPRAGGENSLT